MTTHHGESITTVSTGTTAPPTMTGELAVTTKRAEGHVATMLTGVCIGGVLLSE